MFKVKELQQSQKLRERSSSNEEKNRGSSLNSNATPGVASAKQSSMNVLAQINSANFTDLQKQIKKLKEEFIPKRIERAIETLEDKLKLQNVQTKQSLNKKIEPLEKNIENNKKEIAKLNQTVV
jgi:wobble nucleotide-excising tRNase